MVFPKNFFIKDSHRLSQEHLINNTLSSSSSTDSPYHLHHQPLFIPFNNSLPSHPLNTPIPNTGDEWLSYYIYHCMDDRIPVPDEIDIPYGILVKDEMGIRVTDKMIAEDFSTAQYGMSFSGTAGQVNRSKILASGKTRLKTESNERRSSSSSGEGSCVRKCTHCGVGKTPQWRSGPKGPKTLCNACGVRYKSGRLLPEYRPALSPTSVLDRHSNSHRKVLELRRQKEVKMIVKQEVE